MEWPIEAERDLLADACVPGRHPHALWNFIRFAMGYHYYCLQPGKVYWLTERLHREWCDEIQAEILTWMKLRDTPQAERWEVIECAPREHGKSNLVTKAIPPFVSLIDPNISCYIGSETHPKAQAFLKAIKAVLKGDDSNALFTWFYGNWYNPDRDWNNMEIVHAARSAMSLVEPSIGTFGVETGLTSKHPQLVIYDDPLTEERLKDGGTWLKAANDSLESIYYALSNNSFFVLVGTRYRDDDPIGTSLSKRGVRTWSGHDPTEKYPRDGAWRVHFLQGRDRNNTSRYPKGEPILPEAGFTDDELNRRELANPTYYAAQIMNDPKGGGEMELTKDQIRKLFIKREEVPSIEYATVHLDTAFKDDKLREKGDYNAIVCWLHDIRDTGIVYLDRVLRSKNWRSEDFDNALVRTLHDFHRRGIRVRAITDEKEVGGKRGVYLQHLREVIGSSGLRVPNIIQLNRAGTKKVIRIREAAQYWLSGYARLIDDAENIEVLVDEMAGINRTRHDDVSDAAADVFLPEIWRRPTRKHEDGEPILPIQPGDEVLKGRFERSKIRLQEEFDKLHFSEDHEEYRGLPSNKLNALVRGKAI